MSKYSNVMPQVTPKFGTGGVTTGVEVIQHCFVDLETSLLATIELFHQRSHKINPSIFKFYGSATLWAKNIPVQVGLSQSIQAGLSMNQQIISSLI